MSDATASVWHPSTRPQPPVSDDKAPATPLGAISRETVYQVKRSSNTDTATGQPFMELLIAGKPFARLLYGKAEHLAWIKLVQASMCGAFMGMHAGDTQELYPRLKVTVEASNERQFPCALTPLPWAEADRIADKRRRARFAAEKSAEEKHVRATAIIRKHIIDPEIPDLDAALAEINAEWKREGHSFIPETQSEDTPVQAKTSELDEHIVRDADNQPAATTTERNYGAAWASMNLAYKNLDMAKYAKGKDQHAHIHEILDVQSVKELAHLDNTEISERFARNALAIKNGTGSKPENIAHDAPISRESEPLRPTTAEPTAKPVSGEIASVATGVPASVASGPVSTIQYLAPEMSCVVLFSLWTPGGVEMKYTFRAMSGLELDEMVDGFIARKLKNGYTTQRRVHEITAGFSAPRDEDAPPADDEFPDDRDLAQETIDVKHEDSTAIARSMDGGKPKYTIWYNAGDKETRFPLDIKTPAAVKLLEASLRSLKVNPDKMENGKRYAKPRLRARWTQGKEFAPGKHYRDFVAFEPIAETEDEAIPA